MHLILKLKNMILYMFGTNSERQGEFMGNRVVALKEGKFGMTGGIIQFGGGGLRSGGGVVGIKAGKKI